MLLMGVGGVKVKSVQAGTVSLPVGSTGKDVAISPVNLQKSIVVCVSAASGNSLTTAQAMATAFLADSTTLRVERYSGSNNTATASWQVIEFDGNVSVQYVTGEISNSNSIAITISEVNPERAMVFISAKCPGTSDGVQAYTRYIPWAVVSDPMTLTVQRMSSDSTRTIFHAYVVEVK